MALVALLAALCPPGAAAAAESAPLSTAALPPSPEPAPEPGIRWKSAAAFAGGAATAFAAHESCHLFANLAFGNTPHLESVSFLGFVPFFSIASGVSCVGGRCTNRDGQPFGAGPRGLFTILSAGLQCQHLEDEVILTHEPSLRFVEAPFRKGMLAFNTLTSMGYVLANWLSVEPPAGDLSSIYRNTAAPRTFMNVMLLGVVALDLARYFYPDVAWLPWASRISKLAVTGVTFTL